MKTFILLAFALIGGLVFAQVVAPAAPTYLDGILAWMGQPQAIVGVVISGLEILLRAFKTSVPLSLLIPVKYAVNGAGKVFVWLSANVLDVMISAANNVG